MATAQAASASPTHHRASPGMSPPQPPYPSAARIADSACFPQYTASLKCTSPAAHPPWFPICPLLSSTHPHTPAFAGRCYLILAMLLWPLADAAVVSWLKVWRPTRTRPSASSSSTITRNARRKRFALVSSRFLCNFVWRYTILFLSSPFLCKSVVNLGRSGDTYTDVPIYVSFCLVSEISQLSKFRTSSFFLGSHSCFKDDYSSV